MNIETQQGNERLAVEIKRHDGHEAREVFNKFMAAQKEKHPDRKYYDSSFDDNRSYRTYIAERQGITIGMLMGFLEDTNFEASRLVVDDKYTRSDVTKSLFDALKSDFSEIRLTASPYGYDGDQSQERFVIRRDALIRYYGGLGFTKDPMRTNYDMLWKRQQADNI